MGFFTGTQELVRNSRGKRANSVRATEVLPYIQMNDRKTHISISLLKVESEQSALQTGYSVTDCIIIIIRLHYNYASVKANGLELKWHFCT